MADALDGQPHDRRHARSACPPGTLDPRGRQARPASSCRTTATTRDSRWRACAACVSCEVEKAPKLAPACATPVAEGQVVHVHGEGAEAPARACSSSCSSITRSTARSAIRPGECELQDYTFQEGRADDALSRVRQALQSGRGFRRRRAVRAEPLHPLHALRAVHGGRRAGAGAERLASAATARSSAQSEARTSTIRGPATWSICARWARCSPRISCTRRARGSWTERASVCTGCSQGCNVTLETRDNMVVRLRPRPNLEVNQLLHLRPRARQLPLDEPRRPHRGAAGPDERRAGGHRLGCRARPGARAGARRGRPRGRRWPRRGPRPRRCIWRGGCSRRFDWTGACPGGAWARRRRWPGVPNLALRAERAPNGTRRGAARLHRTTPRRRSRRRPRRRSSWCWTKPTSRSRPKAPLIYVGNGAARARRAAPRWCCRSRISAEEDGTFVNRDGRVQRYVQAKAAPGMARPAWWALGELLAELEGTPHPGSASDVFDAARGGHPKPIRRGLSLCTGCGLAGSARRPRAPRR